MEIFEVNLMVDDKKKKQYEHVNGEYREVDPITGLPKLNKEEVKKLLDREYKYRSDIK